MDWRQNLVPNGPAPSVVIVGAGPAGCAAAIHCAQHGLQATLLENKPFPRMRPGETLHPGILSLLRQLGVDKSVLAAAEIQHEGRWVKWGTTDGFVPYGNDAQGRWRGLQVLRESFDAILLEKARCLGVQIVQPCCAHRPVLREMRVAGVQTNLGDFQARWIIDCTGSNSWLNRTRGLANRRYSPRLLAQYGYCRGVATEHPNCPVLAADREGWTWTARVGRELYQWTRLDYAISKARINPPVSLAKLANVGTSRAADVTWRCSSAPAGPGYFLAGDAAAVLDPASSQGVLRAVMSGIMAAHVISSITSGKILEWQGIEYYREWWHRWFLSDLSVLRNLYRQLDPKPAWLRTQNALFPQE